MLDTVLGKKFYRHNLPDPKPVPEVDHTLLPPITVTVEGASEALATYKAEYELAAQAGEADAVICTGTEFSPAELGVACKMTGIPVRYLVAA